MIGVRTAHTSDLDAATLHAPHAPCWTTSSTVRSPTTTEHALGGIHAMVWDGDALIGHASVIQRRLLHGGRAHRPA